MWKVPSQPSDQFWQSSRCSSRILHSSRCSGYFSHFFQLLLLFPTFLDFSWGVESRRVFNLFIQCISHEISGIFFSIQIQHFFDVTTLASIHLVEYVQRGIVSCRRQHDLNAAQTRAPADLVAHHSQDIQETHVWMRTTMQLELLARIVLSSSICQVVLRMLSPILFCQM